MAMEVRLARADLKRPSPKAAVTPAVSMQGLWRLVFWGSTAAVALLIAVLCGRGVVASQRAVAAVSSLSGTSVAQMRPAAPLAPTFDAEAETKRLAAAVHDLSADNDELKARLATIEHTMDDVTGSIAEVAKAAKTTAAAPSEPILPPWPDAGPPVPATPAAIAAVIAPPLPLPMQFGVDIGSALSIETLRARWAGIRSAHPHLFAGLAPTVTLRETPRANRPELRLVIGPLADADAATHLCAALAPYRLYCEPVIFAGQHVTLQ